MMKNLVSWSQREFHDLPWRKTHDPYQILVSEIMLQQTTVGTVLNHFDRFLKTFPTLKSLALSSEEEVLVAWKGLGYYRRAKNLRKACIDIWENFGGKIPRELDELLKIKGVGDYTARALMAFAYNEPALAVDANIERVCARLFALEEEKGLKLQKKVRALYEDGKLFKKETKTFGSRDLNAALMDLGRVYCQARKADCVLCPLKDQCRVFAMKKALEYPKSNEKLGKSHEKHELQLLRVLHRKGQKVAGIMRQDNEWLAGQYELPTYVLSSTDRNLKQYPPLTMKIDYGALPSFKTTITKYKITNYILKANAKELKELGILRVSFLDETGLSKLSTASLKAIAKAGA